MEDHPFGLYFAQKFVGMAVLARTVLSDRVQFAAPREDAKIKGGFYRVFAAPDDPTSIEEVEAVSLVILSPSMPHSGKGALKSPSTDRASDALMRCRASQRRLRNTFCSWRPMKPSSVTPAK
jgi:hypothetical protein